jgi:hypothetical protein
VEQASFFNVKIVSVEMVSLDICHIVYNAFVLIIDNARKWQCRAMLMGTQNVPKGLAPALS